MTLPVVQFLPLGFLVRLGFGKYKALAFLTLWGMVSEPGSGTLSAALWTYNGRHSAARRADGSCESGAVLR